MPNEFSHILGIRFFTGGLAGAIQLTSAGGLLVFPSAPVLVAIENNGHHRAALEGSDVAFTDSGLLVCIWMLLRRERLERLSGLRFLRGLLEVTEFRRHGATFWIMPSADDAMGNLTWLALQGLTPGMDDCYVAPTYPDGHLSDAVLLATIAARRPRYVIINLGGGVQERLGYFLRTNLSYRPAIICTGAAIAFLSGRQVGIPVWADRLMLGWLFRCFAAPHKCLPRYWKALRLIPLLWRHRSNSIAG